MLQNTHLLTNDYNPAIINEWDFGEVKRFMETREGLGPEEVEEMLEEYRRYLHLTVMHPDKIFPMSADVDPIWHAHLMFTKNYRALERAVGKEINHRPALTEEEVRQLSVPYNDNLLPLYERHWGMPPSKYWKSEGQVCVCNNVCSGSTD